MMGAHQKKTDEDTLMDDGTFSYLSCNCCQKKVKVVDLANEDGAEFPLASTTGPCDLITTLIRQKCKACDKFNCVDCLDECQNCQQQTCRLCLEYVCQVESNS